jgi:uncharacterized protein YjbI with pentapeptide repeats
LDLRIKWGGEIRCGLTDSSREKDERERKKKKNKRERRFRQEQYDMLKHCSEKKDITEWNQWRKENPDEDILLEDADFSQHYLNGVLLNAGGFKNPDTGEFTEFHGEVYLKGAFFERSHLEDADFVGAYLENAILYKSHLENADFRLADLRDAIFWEAHLRGANFDYAHLERVGFDQIHGEESRFEEAHLEGAIFYEAYLEGTRFLNAIVDGSTLFWKCHVDRKTNFRGVGLDNVRVDPGTKQLLEYNIRRKNWEDWYKQHKILRWPVWLFWLMSNYGCSTGRIVAAFLGFAFGFAIIYWLWGCIAPLGIVDYLFVDGNGVKVAWWLVPIRAIHFSVVIMTVGFTNMHANAHSFWAHILVSLQMILGFVLLGALVTRFAVLFTAGGPMGRFAKKDTKVKLDAR